MRWCLLFFTLTIAVFTGECASHSPLVIDGYPVANFAMTVNASEDGGFFKRVFQNPGTLGEWLKDRGSILFSIEKGKRQHSFSGFKEKKVERSFPFVKSAYGQSELITTQINTLSFCPLAVNDAETASLPVLLLELNCFNAGPQEDFEIKITPDSLARNAQAFKASGYSGIMASDFQLSSDAETVWKNGALSIKLSLKAKEHRRVRVMLAFYDDEWNAANRFRSVSEITDFGYRQWSALKASTELFSHAIPQIGDRELDHYLRWYMVPGISLTRYTKNGEVLTMGYAELNQRDSYWTSWLHLVLFKDLEKKMIEESIEQQQSSGKIPTTIFPLIERNDDIDINAFFVLRAVRYYQLYHNRKQLLSWWPSLKKAMDWLIARDTDGNGLPVQVSFWGDWKDVKGVEGRKYAPFSCLIYLAALKQMEVLAGECNDAESGNRYRLAYQKGFYFMNKPVAEGGLWNGHYYNQIWKNGEVNDKLLQDQAIGILFNVVPEKRALEIIASLNSISMTSYGIAETYPYYPASFGYAPGTYHNGGVWPWLSFMDCWARIRAGREKEAIDLVKKVAHADLVASGDWSPNEYINSSTGENMGYQLQGWNAGLFGLVYFGLLHRNMIP
ncbi:hypothetical protein A8C56_09690 [Niabella ginsenosidivorans]|uniref:Glycosyl-hydrolase family 116 catalytic region domain-containing protein n=1 Tax=Niabella ginsenosidivorans TaxID=1176587 RepID=A0A1A9I0P2_9BACT|nr:GH116 family glycosyl hydrolase [Niabella ginsenosidivorans]ANH81218.1 hypothetical protein A8C56_09690 [Niabella ginsenosidivorans]